MNKKVVAVAYCKKCLMSFTIPAYKRLPKDYSTDYVTAINDKDKRFYIRARHITDMDLLHDMEWHHNIPICKVRATKHGLYWWGVIEL